MNELLVKTSTNNDILINVLDIFDFDSKSFIIYSLNNNPNYFLASYLKEDESAYSLETINSVDDMMLVNNHIALLGRDLQ